MTGSKNVYKIIVSGDGGVGKTTLVNRLVCKDEEVAMTPGINIENLCIKLGDNVTADLVFWDLGGQPQFRYFQKSFFEGAQVILLVFDVTRYASFNKLETEWLPIIKKHKNTNNCFYILIGNKIDLEQNIKEDYILQFKEEHDIPYLRISAKEEINVEKLKKLICDIVLSCRN